jgi:predicted transcriptional regulator of viral defense system
MMNYIRFREALLDFKIFSLTDIKKVFPEFDSRRLVEWQKKGYINKVINRWYIFADRAIEDKLIFWVANRIYRPSYISLETALSYYGFIPEAVFKTTSVSTLKTTSFDTNLGTIAYQHMKPALFFGYKIVEWHNFPIKIAEPEKVILDYLYLNPQLGHHEDWEAMRLNKQSMHASVNCQKVEEYLQLFQIKALDNRVSHFLAFMEIC